MKDSLCLGTSTSSDNSKSELVRCEDLLKYLLQTCSQPRTSVFIPLICPLPLSLASLRRAELKTGTKIG